MRKDTLSYTNECKPCVRARHKKNYMKSREHVLAKHKKWKSENLEAVKKASKLYFSKNKDKIQARNWERTKRRLKEDTNFRIATLLRKRLWSAVRFVTKSGSSVKDLGITIDGFRKYIESKFYPHKLSGELMSWSNWGIHGWHLDHIVPLSRFDLQDRKQFLKAVHYTNLQPLWAEENRSKGAKYEGC